MSMYFNTVSFNWSNLFLMELMFKFLVNTLFLFRSLTSRISDKEFRETLLMDPLLNWYVQVISELSNFSEFKLLVLVFSDERVFSLKDTSWLHSQILKTKIGNSDPDFRSESKGSRFDSGCYLCSAVNSCPANV